MSQETHHIHPVGQRWFQAFLWLRDRASVVPGSVLRMRPVFQATMPGGITATFPDGAWLAQIGPVVQGQTRFISVISDTRNDAVRGLTVLLAIHLGWKPTTE